MAGAGGSTSIAVCVAVAVAVAAENGDGEGDRDVNGNWRDKFRRGPEGAKPDLSGQLGLVIVPVPDSWFFKPKLGLVVLFRCCPERSRDGFCHDVGPYLPKYLRYTISYLP